MKPNKLLVLSQIGSPQSPDPDNVGLYLQKFLMDPRIITVPYFIRWPLVNIGIVPRRKYSSAEKYQRIWTESGSPLVVETIKFAKKLQDSLNAEISSWEVLTHWRYGDDTSKQLAHLIERPFSEIYIAPMYPQYAEATTASALDVLVPELKKHFPQSALRTLKPFYNTNEWQQAWAQKLTRQWENFDHMLFSFHGLPLTPAALTYDSHCKESAHMIAELVGLPRNQFTITYQSRVGPKKWLGPATDDVAKDLARKGVKSLLVACPAFVTDGLETLEEINLELRETFLKAGGEKFEMLASLNDDEIWVEGFSSLLLKNESWKLP